MDDDASKPRFLLTILAAFWVMAFGYSFVAFAITTPDDVGITGGLDRVNAFLGWQGIAGILGLCLFGVSRAWPKGSVVRRNSAMPLVLAILLVLGILGVIGWARIAR